MTTTEPITTSTRPVIDEVLEAVAAERDALPRGVELVDVGPARLDPDRSGPIAAAFVVDTGTLRLGDRLLTGLYLAEEAADPVQYPVRDVLAWPDDLLHIEVEIEPGARRGFAPAGPRQLRLFASSSATFVLRSLHQRLGASRDALGLAAPLLAAVPASTHGRPGPVPAELGVILGPAERREETLAGALDQLAAAGHSVLLVSADNRALDRIVLAAQQRAGFPAAGYLLRAGLPSSEQVGRDPRLTIDGAAGALAPAVLRRLHDLASELRTASEGPGAASRPAVTAQQTGEAAEAADDARAAHRSAAAAPGPPAPTAGSAPIQRAPSQPPDGDERGSLHIASARKLERARRALATADEAVTAAVTAAREASAAHAAARQAIRHMDEARTTYRVIDELARRVEATSGDTAASAAGVGRLAADAGRARQLLVAAEVATVRLDRRDEALAELEAIGRNAARLAFSRADVALADRELARARAAHAAAERAALRARADRARAATVVEELSNEIAEASADTVDRRAAETRRPVVEAARHRSGSRSGAARLAALRADHGRARAELASHQRAAIQSAQVVVATFAQLVANPAIYERVYDNVLVEQAGRAPAALTLWAAACAARAVTLATEPGERPAQPALEPGAVPGEVARWVSCDLLELVGLQHPSAVAAHVSGLILA